MSKMYYVAEETRNAVIEGIAAGKPMKAILAECGIKKDEYFKIQRTAAQEVRDATQDLCEERFMASDARLEWLYTQIVERLTLVPVDDPSGFSALAKAAVTILERIAKQWGTDAERQRGQGGNDWLSKDSPAELERLATKHGIPLPKPFSVPE